MTRSRITVTLSYPVERVWDTVTNLHDIRWRSDLQTIKVIDESTFIEVTTQGVETHFKVTRVDQYKLWEFDIENDAIQGHWTGVFSQHGTITNLEFTEDIIAKRFIIKPFVYFYLHQQQRRYIRDLKNKLREENN